MTKIKVVKTHIGVQSIFMEGHANSDVWGKDLVCCALSASFQYLLVGVGHVLDIDPNELIFEPQNAKFYVKFSNEQIKKSFVLTETFMHMIDLLKVKHSQFINLEVINEQN